MIRNSLFSLFMLLGLCCNDLLAVDDLSYRAKSGDQALLFSLKGLSDLSPQNFNGGVGFQYYFANHSAFRLGLGLNFENESKDKPDTTYPADYSRSSVNFTFMPGIRYNFGTSSNVLAYMGSEAIIALSKSTEEGKNFADQTTVTKANQYGLGFFLGAEWFAFKNVSLSAEYSFRLKYEIASEEISSPNVTTIKNELPDKFTAGLGNSALYFTLSFYFN